jgi:hypothetical protein
MITNKYPQHEAYPFNTADIEKVITKKRSREAVNELSGEVMLLTDTRGGQVRMIDSGNFIKMFPEGMLLISRIGKRGLSLLFWILDNLKTHATEIEIKREEVLTDSSNLKGDGFYVAIKELLDYGFLAARKGKKNVYYINCNMFFNGDRRRKIKKL